MGYNIYKLYIAAFFKSQMLLTPVLLLFYLSNGLTVGDYFLFQGIMTLLTLFLEIPIGYITDRTSIKTIFSLSLLFLILRSLIWIFYSGYFAVLIGEMFYVISKICFDSINSSYIFLILKQQNKPSKMETVYGHINFIMYLSTAIASILGTFLFDKIGITVLLSLEVCLFTIAFIFVLTLPAIAKQKHHKKNLKYKFTLSFHAEKCFQVLKYLFHKPSVFWLMLYSALLVALSNFFFWSFQPLLKMSAMPIALFGVVMFINNFIRCLSSYYVPNIKKLFGMFNLGKIIYVAEASSILLLLFSLINHRLNIVVILWLCICIGLQLAFTIMHISRLQKIILSPIRNTSSAINMMIARLFTASLLIGAKFLLSYYPITYIILIYPCILLIPLGAGLLYKISFYKLR